MKFKQIAEMIKNANEIELLSIQEGFESGLKEYLKEKKVYSPEEKKNIMESMTPEIMQSFLKEGFNPNEAILWINNGYNVNEAKKVINKMNEAEEKKEMTREMYKANVEAPNVDKTHNPSEKDAQQQELDKEANTANINQYSGPQISNVDNKLGVMSGEPTQPKIEKVKESEEKNININTLMEAPEDEDTDALPTEIDTDEESMTDAEDPSEEKPMEEDNAEDGVICFYVDKENFDDMMATVGGEGSETGGEMGGGDLGGVGGNIGGESDMGEDIGGDEDLGDMGEEEPTPENEEEKPMESKRHKKNINKLMENASHLLAQLKSMSENGDMPELNKKLTAMFKDYTKVDAMKRRKDEKSTEADLPKTTMANGKNTDGIANPSQASGKGGIGNPEGKGNKSGGAKVGAIGESVKTLKEQNMRLKKEIARLNKINESMLKDLIISEEGARLNYATKEQIKEAVSNVSLKDTPVKVKALVESHVAKVKKTKEKKFKGVMKESSYSTNSNVLMERMRHLAGN